MEREALRPLLEADLSQVVEQAGALSPTDLVATLRRLDAFTSAGGVGLPPKLAHFLSRRSYGKALLWLRGDDSVPA